MTAPRHPPFVRVSIAPTCVSGAPFSAFYGTATPSLGRVSAGFAPALRSLEGRRERSVPSVWEASAIRS